MYFTQLAVYVLFIELDSHSIIIALHVPSVHNTWFSRANVINDLCTHSCCVSTMSKVKLLYSARYNNNNNNNNVDNDNNNHDRNYTDRKEYNFFYSRSRS